MSEEPDDPLDGADIGETKTVEHTVDMWLGDLAHEQTRGSDRFATHEVADIEVRTDEYGEQILDVTVESEVTKRLARRWDRAPRKTSNSRKGSSPSTAQRAAGVLIGFAVSVGIGTLLTQRMFAQMAGETIEISPHAPSLLDLAPAIGAIALLAVFIMAALSYLPGMAGRGGRL